MEKNSKIKNLLLFREGFGSDLPGPCTSEANFKDEKENLLFMNFQSDDTGSIASEDDTQYGKASKFQDISDRAKAGLICEKDGMFLIICNCFYLD